MSSTVQITVTNYYAQEITLPRELGGAALAAGASKVLRINHAKIAEDDQNVQRPMIAALKNLLNTSRAAVEAEDTGEVSAGAAVYNLTAAKKQIVPNTLVVTIIDNAGDPITLKDDGAGALDEVGGTGTGTVNYTSGAIVVNNNLTSGTPGTGDAILLDYVKQEVGVEVVGYPLVNAAYGVPAQDLADLIDAAAAQSQAGIRKGQAVFTADTSIAVVLSPPAPDDTYVVLLTPEFAPPLEEVAHVTAKSATGFSVTFSAAQTGTVNWLVIQ